MASTTGKIHILLIHVRESVDMANHERRCIEEVSGLHPDQLTSINVAIDTNLSSLNLEDFDAVIIGGSGHHSVTQDYPFTQPLIDAVRTIAKLRIPLLGCCWGHQFIARALGGIVVHDPESAEVGNHEVFSTESIADDPIFNACPSQYLVLMGHEDRVSMLPPGAIELAYSHTCRNQAFRFKDLPIYGTQFHTELTPESLVTRLRLYTKYVSDPAALDRMAETMQPTPEAADIILRFLKSIPNYTN